MEPLRLALSIEWDDCTVALAGAGIPCLELGARASLAAGAGAQASRDALSLVQRLLFQTGQPLSAVESFHFNCGPGAFTSLRIAAGLVQGLALPRRRPVGGVGSLQALAATVPAWWSPGAGATSAEHAGATGVLKNGPAQAAPLAADSTSGGVPAGGRDRNGWLLCAALDARMGECYYAAYGCLPGHWPETWLLPAVGTPEQAAGAFEMLCRARGVGPGQAELQLAGSAFADFEPLRDWALRQGSDLNQVSGRRPSARAVLAMAGSIGAPSPGAARDAKPFYVRDRVALDRDEQRRAAVARKAACQQQAVSRTDVGR
ncbi:MAG: tRNA (adenosine(37)-N6)-threonylcarbamoyltransferase complex dimerization subunit type 1 TsaB [Lautropia sp.]|nr:tRNA (adenosine(37)-N6)-threonylcarbamoyltransferase complex dimerization subunit type 1 TsaB [Lautropia sp.]